MSKWIIAALCSVTVGIAALCIWWPDAVWLPQSERPSVPPPRRIQPIEVDLPGQGRAYILCDGGNRVYFSPDGGVAVTLDRNECP